MDPLNDKELNAFLREWKGPVVPLRSHRHDSTEGALGKNFSSRLGGIWETRLEPPSPFISRGLDGAFVNGPSAVHRFLTDTSSHRYFGYDMVIEHLDQASTFI